MFRLNRRFQSMSLVGLALVLTQAVAAQEGSATIEEGTQVSMTYTLTVDGEVLQSNAGEDPLVFAQGGGQVLPSLEAELVGLGAGDRKTVNLDPVNGYGEVDQAGFQEVPLDQIPEQALEVGTMLRAEGHNGPIRVVEIKDETVVLDFNHPLAGKALTFDITIVSVQEAAQ